MANKSVRLVNVVPTVTVKQEPLSDEEDTVATCKLCLKGFASETALNNHARMEHMKAFATGDPSEWTGDPSLKRTVERKVKEKTDDLITSLAPVNLKSLASKEVSYIIIKDESGMVLQSQSTGGKMKRKKTASDDSEVDPVVKRMATMREPKPITGPFECLEPSNLVADGTCHQIFFSCCEYSIHYRDEHTRRRKGIRCQVCEKPLNPGVENDMPYVCQVCGVGFATKKELSEHGNTAHIKMKPFECRVCRKRFTQQGGVQQHMRMHTGDRPFNCTFCPKAFTQKSGLDQHVRIHTKVKPYRCVVCDKTFCQSVHLKQHMRTHTNVAPYQCGICQKRFKQGSHLNYHLKGHNVANMTDEQRQKYTELLSLMTSGQVEQVEYEQEIVEQDDDTEQVDEENVQVEQIEDQMALSDGNETYILSDSGHETWSIQLEG